MKILIVDDERSTRESIKLLVDFDAYGVTDIIEAKNGYEGYKRIVEEKPDLVFLDMNMPIVEGSELLEMISEKAFAGKVIVISGYTDFKYTKAAIINDFVTDYIQKPIDSVQLNRAVQKSLGIGMSVEDAGTAFTGVKDTVGTDKSAGLCFALIIKGIHEKVKVNYNSNFDLFRYMLISQVEKKMPDAEMVCDSRNSYPYCFIFRTEEKDANGIKGALASLKKEISVKHSIEALILLDTASDGFGDNEASGRMKEQLHRFNLNSSEEIVQICCNTEQDISHEEKLDIYNESVALSELIVGGSDLTDWNDRFFNELGKLTYLSVYDLRTVMSGLAYQVCRQLERYIQDSQQVMAASMEKLYSKTRFCDLSYHRDWLTELEKQMLMRLSKAEKDIPDTLKDMMFFIQNHHNEKITLNRLSDEFYLSSSHISRLFTKHLDMNYSDFINRTRLERAKELLNNPDEKIKTVAIEVGFDSSGYFSKQFKKYFGMTPHEYRSRQGRQK